MTNPTDDVHLRIVVLPQSEEYTEEVCREAIPKFLGHPVLVIANISDIDYAPMLGLVANVTIEGLKVEMCDDPEASAFERTSQFLTGKLWDLLDSNDKRSHEELSKLSSRLNDLYRAATSQEIKAE